MKKLRRYLPAIIFALLLLVIWVLAPDMGKGISDNFIDFSLTMLKFVPLVFLLIGLFEVWVDRETVEKHLGDNSGPLAFFWAILLAESAVGGLYVAFPVAHSLHKKGARLAIIFTYLGAAAVVRIPMALFEAAFLGPKFTLIRILVSLPLVILSSLGLERYLKREDYRVDYIQSELNTK